jgi:hypothetical protein
VDFTREPIIESIITPKEGYKLVIRSSKGAGHEEFFVDAVEVVSFGHTFFLRSLERPKSFLVPASDYEILEVRETRMVLKNVGLDSSIKIGGGKEQSPKKEAQPSKETAETDDKGDKKRDRRRQSRRRRGRDEVDSKETSPEEAVQPTTEPKAKTEQAPRAPAALLPPPSTLISETIARYKGDQLFKDVFFPKDEVQNQEEASEEETASFLRQDEDIQITTEDPFNIADDEETPKEDPFNTSSPTNQSGEI